MTQHFSSSKFCVYGHVTGISLSTISHILHSHSPAMKGLLQTQPPLHLCHLPLSANFVGQNSIQRINSGELLSSLAYFAMYRFDMYVLCLIIRNSKYVISKGIPSCMWYFSFTWDGANYWISQASWSPRGKDLAAYPEAWLPSHA